MNNIRFTAPLGLLSVAPTPATPQAMPPTAYAALRWRLIGPYRGGRVLAVAGVPGDPATFYFGAVDGGVWRTQNAGVTWEPLFDDQPIASIGAIALAPSDPNVIYVGTGEAAIRSDITYGAGVYKSTDGGAHWRALGLADTRHIGKVLVDARNPDVVLGAALGHAYGPNPERGVFRSPTAAAAGPKSSIRIPIPGPSIWRPIPPIPGSCTPRCIRRAARRGSSTRPTKDRGAACTSRPTAALTGCP